MATYSYGAPLLTRQSDIKSKAESTRYFSLEVMGRYQSLKQITVRIGLPVYRIENGRTRTFQKEYLATHPDVSADLFTLDPESLEAQKAQHSILKKLAYDQDLLKEFESGTQQTEPLIATNTGVIVNGNRRLCAWRTLYERDPIKYKHYEYIDIAILPDDCDEAEIKTLEKRLQIQKTHRAEYKWHNKASMMKEEYESGVSLDSIAKTYDESKKDVETLIGAFDYADIYLRSLDKTDQWSLVDGDGYAFIQMVEERKKISEQGRKELFEAVCFKLIANKDYQGRLYSAIPDISKNLDSIVKELISTGVLPSVGNNECEPEINDLEAHDDVDLLSGIKTKQDESSAFVVALNESDSKIGGLVKRIIDEQKTIQSEQKSARYLLNMLAKASSYLLAAQNEGLNENSITGGAQVHLNNIKETVASIEKWVNARRS